MTAYIMLFATFVFSLWFVANGQDPSAFTAASFVIAAMIGGRP